MGSNAASIFCEEHGSEDSQEEYSQDGYVYQRDNANRHGHRDRDEYFQNNSTVPDTRRHRHSVMTRHYYSAKRRKRTHTNSSKGRPD